MVSPMPAVVTQQLASIADLDLGPSTSAMVKALAGFDTATKNVYLRRASAKVLAAYAIRFGRPAGASFTLAKWGDLTIGMTCSLARWAMLSDRGYNPALPADTSIKAQADEATAILDEISDITNKTPRRDPDVSDGTDGVEELGSLACSEGGAYDEADAWAKAPPGMFGGALP